MNLVKTKHKRVRRKVRVKPIARKPKRKILVSELRRSYKQTGSIKKTSIKTGATYKQVQEATMEKRLTRRDKIYRNLLVKNKHFKNNKIANNYIFKIKNLHRREKRIYDRPVTQWVDPYEGVE